MTKHNSARVEGGAIWNAARVHLTHATVAFNSSREGGGILNAPNATLTLTNSIVALNEAHQGPDISGAIVSFGVNLIGTTSGMSGYTNDDIVNVDPLLGPLQNNGDPNDPDPTETHALLAGSLAIDAADNSLATAFDQRGVSRGLDADIGAFEVETP